MKKRQPEHTVEELRRMLRGITWGTFFTKSILRINGVDFVAKLGLHLGRAAIAVFVEDRFIACRYIVLPQSFSTKHMFILKPEHRPYSYRYGG